MTSGHRSGPRVGCCASLIVACMACGRVGFDELPPDADVPPGPANLVFVTSTMVTGGFGGVAAADAMCAQHAATAGMSGTFVAWLSGASIIRLSESRGWTRVDGVALADQPSDFISNLLLAPIALDERGQPVGGNRIWTGLTRDGAPAADCVQWTSALATDGGLVGTAQHGGGRFTHRATSACDQIAHVLCIEFGKVSPVRVERAQGRFAFVSSQVWAPDGVASADAICQTDAAHAGLRGSYLAALPTASQPTSARFDLQGPPWIRTDGALIAATAAELFSSPQLATFINRRADGLTAPSPAQWWAGDPSSVALATNNCADWISRGGFAVIGDVEATVIATVFGATTTPCNSPEHLLCLQE